MDDTLFRILSGATSVVLALGLFKYLKRRESITPPKRRAKTSPPLSSRDRLAAMLGDVSVAARVPITEGKLPRLQPQNKALALDTPDFTPISDTQAKQLAAGVGAAWRNPFFGRRDLIPAASDPRTSVIDRAMVGQGLITPEELTQIHDIGAQMDLVRPDIATAHVR